jgi:hypothetical protein
MTKLPDYKKQGNGGYKQAEKWWNPERRRNGSK